MQRTENELKGGILDVSALSIPELSALGDSVIETELRELYDPGRTEIVAASFDSAIELPR